MIYNTAELIRLTASKIAFRTQYEGLSLYNRKISSKYRNFHGMQEGEK